MSARAFVIFIILTCVSIVTSCFYIKAQFLNHPKAATLAQLHPVPQKTKEIKVGDDSSIINLKVTTVPKFIFSLLDQKFQHLWEVDAAEKQNLVSADLSNAKGDVSVDVKTEFDDANKELIVSPDPKFKVKPGLYNLSVTVKTPDGEDVTLHQDFTWGVLAINTNKGTYKIGEVVKVGMAVLGDFGNTKCKITGDMTPNGAKVWLTITGPTGQVQQLSTDNNTIVGSPDCADKSVTVNPDFYTSFRPLEPGTYSLHMVAQHAKGIRSIDSTLTVTASDPDFDIERTVYPTRIYPKVDYPVMVTVKANKDYSGSVSEVMPKSFKIMNISGAGKNLMRDNYQAIDWQVDWKKGFVYTLSYTIHFPQVSPEFYLVGPITIGSYSEGREWKIASDSLFQLVQEAHSSASGVSSLTVTFNNPATQGDLLVLICSRPDSNTFNRPTSWSSSRFGIRSTPSVYLFDRITPAGGLSSATCTARRSGSLNAQVLEFSGVSTAGFFDKVGGALTGSTSCNSGSHTASLGSITPSNPDELIISAFASTAGGLSVTAHNSISGAGSTGFTDTSGGGFNQSTISSDSGWGEAVNNPPVAENDAASFSGSATRCSGEQVAYNPTVSLSQGGYRFFDNADNINPGSPLAAANTDITLNRPGAQFRIRMLVDLDSTGTSLSIDSADFILQYAPLPASGNCADGNYSQVLNQSDGTPIAFVDQPTVTIESNILSSGNDPSDTGYTTALESFYDDANTDGQGGTIAPDITNHQNVLSNGNAGLWDFSLVDNTDDAVSTTYCLQLANGDGSALDVYHTRPRITTILNDVVVRGGTTIRGGSIIQ